MLIHENKCNQSALYNDILMSKNQITKIAQVEDMSITRK